MQPNDFNQFIKKNSPVQQLYTRNDMWDKKMEFWLFIRIERIALLF